MKFVCTNCERYAPSTDEVDLENYGICAKCKYAFLKYDNGRNKLSDEDFERSIFEALQRKPEETLLGTFREYFPKECYEGFDALVEKYKSLREGGVSEVRRKL